MDSDKRFSDEVEKQLRGMGWHPGRAIDISEVVQILRDTGKYPVTEPIKSFLQEFGNLNLADKHGYLVLSTIFSHVDWWEDEVKPIRDYLNLSLCPIAIAHGTLWLMGKGGKVYSTDGSSYFGFEGYTGDEAIENQLRRRRRLPSIILDASGFQDALDSAKK